MQLVLGLAESFLRQILRFLADAAQAIGVAIERGVVGYDQRLDLPLRAAEPSHALNSLKMRAASVDFIPSADGDARKCVFSYENAQKTNHRERGGHGEMQLRF